MDRRLYDQRYEGEGIDPETSADIADELRSNNHVDAQGFLLQDGNDIGASITRPIRLSGLDGLRPRIKVREVINQPASCEVIAECTMIMPVVPSPLFRHTPHR